MKSSHDHYACIKMAVGAESVDRLLGKVIVDDDSQGSTVFVASQENLPYEDQSLVFKLVEICHSSPVDSTQGDLHQRIRSESHQ